ncbi:hypothetical protein LINPERPRIM_LOCUS29754, partial [Linum perenne]
DFPRVSRRFCQANRSDNTPKSGCRLQTLSGAFSPTVTRPHSIDKSINSDTRILSTLLIRPPGRIQNPLQFRRS